MAQSIPEFSSSTKVRHRFLWAILLPLFVAVMVAGKLFLVFALGPLLDKVSDLQIRRVERLLSVAAPLANKKILIVGDSTATYNLDASGLPDTISLGTLNGTSIETYYVARRFLELGLRPRCIISSLSFQWRENRVFFWSLFVRNGFFSGTDLNEIFELSRQLQVPPSTGGWLPFAMKNFLYGRRLLGDDLWSIRDALRYGDALRRYRESFMARIEERSGSILMRSEDDFIMKISTKAFPKTDVSGLEQEYFRKFAELLAKNNIRLYQAQIPISSAVSARESAEYARRFEEITGAALKEYGGRVVRLGVLPADNFLADGHLNARGVALVMPRLRSALDPDCSR